MKGLLRSRTFASRALERVLAAEGLASNPTATSALGAECGGDLRQDLISPRAQRFLHVFEAINALQLRFGGAKQIRGPGVEVSRAAARVGDLGKSLESPNVAFTTHFSRYLWEYGSEEQEKGRVSQARRGGEARHVHEKLISACFLLTESLFHAYLSVSQRSSCRIEARGSGVTQRIVMEEHECLS